MTENSKRHLPDSVLEAEALARADESKVEILRGLARQNDAYKADLERAITASKESSDHVADLNGFARGPEDLSGVVRTLSDSAGNFAPNVEVAQVGGIGVEASNTKADTDEQAQTAEDVDLSGAQVGVGQAGEIGTGAVDIPADWESGHWRTRVALAEKISGRNDVKAEEANGIISAEAERRKV